MRDKELYQQILGLSKPWVVESVALEKDKGQIEIKVTLTGPLVLCCPECDKSMPGYDKRERSWRHLDTCQYKTIVTAEVPRGTCESHGVRQIRVPWAEPGSQFTALFERLLIDWLGEASQTAVARQFDLSWAEVNGVMKRAVDRGLARRELKDLHLVGVDEKAFKKGHNYFTIVSNLEDGTVLYVEENRTRAALESFYDGLSPEERGEIYAVAMDMWDPYVNATADRVPDAAIVFDKFHVVRYLVDAVDKVRRQENKALRKEGDDRLVGTKYHWLTNPKNMRPELKAGFAELRKAELKTSRAWAIKELFAKLWNYTYEGSARKFFKSWYGWASRCRLDPIRKAAKTVKNHIDNILTYLKFPITNAMAEGINSKIQWIKYTARGFRNAENFKTAIFFHCGNLQLHPHGI